jgi:hypothetical protein
VHRIACLPEIDCVESGRCPAHGPKAPLGFLNKVEQRVRVLISRGQRRGERALERGKRGDQVTPMVDRARRRAQAARAFGRFANSFASGLYSLVVDDRAATDDRTLGRPRAPIGRSPARRG